MKTLAWVLKFIVFPLLPFFFGVTIRCLQADCFEFSAISPVELAFSMALLMLVLSGRISRLDNTALRDALTQVFQIGIIIYLVLFSWTIFLESSIETTRANSLHTVQVKLKDKSPILSEDLPMANKAFELILSRLRWFTVILSLIIIPLAIIACKKYDLEKL